MFTAYASRHPMQNEVIRLGDGYEAHSRRWSADAAPGRACVLYFHGIQSHGGWYEASGAALARAGFDVFMPDRRGSGENAPPRGHFESPDVCLDDSARMLDHALENSAADAAHVVGVSWGGKQAVWLAQAFPDRVASITLVAPGLFPVIDLSRSEKFCVAMSMVNDRDRMFDIPLNDPTLFTDNPEKIRYVERDPLKLMQVSASFLLSSRLIDRRIRHFDRSAYRGPVHLMLAGKERIIENDRTRRWFNGLPSPVTRLTEFPDAGHTIEFERDPSEFLASLTGFLTELPT